MMRGGFESRQVAYVSGHKSISNLNNYDSLTVVQRTKMALAMQRGHATLDGDEIDLDTLARGGRKRKTDSVDASTSKKANDGDEYAKVLDEAIFVYADDDL